MLVTVTLPPDVEGWAVPAGYSGQAEVVAENGDSVDIRCIGGPGDGEIEPVDREYIADSAPAGWREFVEEEAAKAAKEQE